MESEKKTAKGLKIEYRSEIDELLIDSYDIDYLIASGSKIERVDDQYFVTLTVDVTHPQLPELVTVDDFIVASFEEDVFEDHLSAIKAIAADAWSKLKEEVKTQAETDFASLEAEFQGQGIEFERDADGDIVVDFSDTSIGFEKGSASLPSSKETAFDIEEAREIARKKIEERTRLASVVGRTPDDRPFDVISDGTYNDISRNLVVTDVGASHAGVNILNEPRTFQFDKHGLFLVAYDGQVVRDVIAAETPKHLSEVKAYYSDFGICIFKDERDGYWVGTHTNHLPIDREGWKKASNAQWVVSIRDADKTAEELKRRLTRPTSIQAVTQSSATVAVAS